jgi:DNA-binding transcriptional LysR family regulator
MRDERFVFGREGNAAGLDDHAIEKVGGIGGRLSSSTQDVSQDVVMQFVALGFGLSLVSDLSTTIPYPGVAFRLIAGEGHHVSYSVVWLPGNDNPALRRFLSLSRSKSAERRETAAPQASD